MFRASAIGALPLGPAPVLSCVSVDLVRGFAGMDDLNEAGSIGERSRSTRRYVREVGVFPDGPEQIIPGARDWRETAPAAGCSAPAPRRSSPGPGPVPSAPGGPRRGPLPDGDLRHGWFRQVANRTCRPELMALIDIMLSSEGLRASTSRVEPLVSTSRCQCACPRAPCHDPPAGRIPCSSARRSRAGGPRTSMVSEAGGRVLGAERGRVRRRDP